MDFGKIRGLFGASKSTQIPQPTIEPPIDDFVHVFPAVPTAQPTNTPTATAPNNTAAVSIAAFGEGIYEKFNLPIVHRARTGLFVIVLGYPEPAFKVLTPEDTITLCVRIYANAYPRGIVYNKRILREGLKTLAGIAQTLSLNLYDEVLKYKVVLHRIQHAQPHIQRTLSLILVALLDTLDWPTEDEYVVKRGEFELSAVAWAMHLGPIGIAAGFIQGKGARTSLLAREDRWVAENLEKENAQERREMIADFAGGVCAWGREVIKKEEEFEKRWVVKRGDLKKRFPSV